MLYGGVYDRRTVHLLTEITSHARIQLGLSIYERVDDPGTGDFLGAYVYAGRGKPSRRG